MKTVKPIGLLIIGTFAFFLAGCFNPISVVPSNTEEIPVVEPFSMDVFIGPDAGTRTVAGPDAARVKGDIRNIVQLIVTDTDGHIVAFDEVRRQRDADNDAELSIDSLVYGRTYNFLLLMGHWERTYEENQGEDYIYTNNPPTLMAAGLKTQVVSGSGKVTVTMWPVVADTAFISPVAATVQPVVTAGKPEAATLLPVNWDARWTIQQGASGSGLNDLVRAQKIPNPTAGDALRLKSAQTLVRVGGAIWSNTAPNGNIVIQDIGSYTSGFGQIGTSGSVNFKLEYVPYNLTAGGLNPWTALDDDSVFELSGNGEPVWIIRNGVNDLDQNGNTDFTSFHNIDLGMTTANGNGAVRFVVEPKIPGGGPGGGSTLVVKDGVFIGPSSSKMPQIGFTTAGYTGTAEGYYAVVAKNDLPPEHSAYTGPLGSLAVNTHTKQITLPAANGDYDVYVIIFKDGAVSNALKINTGSGGTGVDWNWGDEPYLSLYVASFGQDDFAGTRAYPLATVQEALSRLKTAYTTNPDWPGKGTGNTQGAAIIIIDTVYVSQQISISNSGSIYPNILLKDDDLTPNGTLQAVAGIGRLLYIASNAKVALSGGLKLQGTGVESDNVGGVAVSGSTFTMNGGEISGNFSPSGGGVIISSNSTFIMNEGKISGNYSGYYGGGVRVDTNSTFTMNGGEISGNSCYAWGGGVAVHGDGGKFTMNAGKIYDNKIYNGYGGGVYVNNSSEFDMKGGEISGNFSLSGGGVFTNGIFTMMAPGKISGNSSYNGAGVYIYHGSESKNDSTFTMNGGEISDNHTIYYAGEADTKPLLGGGGVLVGHNTSFAMNGGKISGNSAHEWGGGVCVLPGMYSFTSFKKTDGIIYGYDDGDLLNSNVVKNEGGVVKIKDGHAIYINHGIPYRIDATVGPEVKLYYNSPNEGNISGF
jgi:hypothetical protein